MQAEMECDRSLWVKPGRKESGKKSFKLIDIISP